MKTVKNLLQVVPNSVKEAVAANDSDVKERVEASLKADVKMKDVNGRLGQQWRRPSLGQDR